MCEMLACESCWTHSIPIDETEGDIDEMKCPVCGSSWLLVEHDDDLDLSKWHGGRNQKYTPNYKAQPTAAAE